MGIISPVCDSYVRPETLVRICDECNFGTYGGRCIICGSPGEDFVFYISPYPPHPPAQYAHSARFFVDFCRYSHVVLSLSPSYLGISDAYYCAECTRLEKDRDGCPKIVNLGASRTDLFYERRRLGAFVLLLFVRMSDRLTDCLFQASRRVSLRHYSSSEIFVILRCSCDTNPDKIRYKSTTDTAVAINKRKSCEALVMSWVVDGTS